MLDWARSFLAVKGRSPEPDPDAALTYLSQGVSLQALGDLDAAEACYRRALALDSDSAQAYANLGALLHRQGRLEQASEHYHRAVQLNPELAEAHFNIGLVLQQQGAALAAIDSFQRALRIRPDFSEVHSCLGNVYLSLDRREEAAASCLRGLQLAPHAPDLHSNLGLILNAQDRFTDAVESFEKALALQPDHVPALNNLGQTWQSLGDTERALGCYRAVLERHPTLLQTHSNLLQVMTFRRATSPDDYLKEASRYGSIASRVTPFARWTRASGDAAVLRVGIVSGDLVAHPVGYFLEGIVGKLDRSKVELVAYVTQPMEDDVTARLKPSFSVWRSLNGLSDEAAAERIHEDGIHILVDLAGHTAHNRLPVFAWKPAPVQVSWLGYWASTGLAEIDYFLADPVSAPDSQRPHFTEKIWRLPETRLCFTAPTEAVPVAPLPAEKNGYVTFGSFQNLAKIDNGTLALWSRVMQSVPASRLRLQAKQLGDGATRQALLLRLKHVGIDAERVTLAGPSMRQAYLAAHNAVDIILDTFPFPGGTTTCEALWMGVPTLTLAGHTLLSRQGASLLTCAGLEEWVAHGEDEFVAKAVANACDVERLMRLRAGLRQQVLASPLFDAERFARRFETALACMWEESTRKPEQQNA
jgi:protein O-GlcNAc transferase